MNTRRVVAVLLASTIIVLFVARASGVYHPTLGRFLQRDPIGYVDGNNLYRYAQNAPAMGVDPSGLRVRVMSFKAKDEGVLQYDEDGKLVVDDAGKPIKWKTRTLTLEKYQKNLKRAIETVNTKFTDKKFKEWVDKKRVFFADKQFTGNRKEYLDKLKRERTSAEIEILAGGLQTGLRKAKDLIAGQTEDYDITAVGAHGTQDGRLALTGTFVEARPTREKLLESIAGAAGKKVVYHCYMRKPTEKVGVRYVTDSFTHKKGIWGMGCKLSYKPMGFEALPVRK